MRFSIKIFICTVLLVAAAFCAGGTLLISRNLEDNLDREISRSLDEHLSLRFMLESGIISEELQSHELSDEALGRVAQQISAGLTSARGSREIIVHDKLRRRIYPSSAPKSEDRIRLQPLLTNQTKYRLEKDGPRYLIYITGLFEYDGMPLYLSYIRDITDVFVQRDSQLRVFMMFDIAIVLVSAAALFGISWLLTRPIRRLTAVSRRIAGGQYSVRARVRSSDEVGELTESFNRMAGSVQEKILELEAASRTKDEFIANFTHELKTPMTSIIGYADMLRSSESDNPTVFKAANYIFQEGRRLESLSLKMLDLLLLEKHAFQLRPMDCPALLEYIRESMAASYEREGIQLTVSAEPGVAMAEPDLIKTLLINLADNARKASSPGGMVELSGKREGDRYALAVSDHGRGIPEQELGRITEAFYMVDKSRARAQHGAGLGLAIASRIAELHGAKLDIRSIVGLGTSVGIGLAICDAPEEEDADEE